MLSRKADGPLVVVVPRPRDDRPVWWRVGVIAVVGFAVGLIWPHFVGLAVPGRSGGPVAPEAPSSPVASAGPPPGASAPPTSSTIADRRACSGRRPSVAPAPSHGGLRAPSATGRSASSTGAARAPAVRHARRRIGDKDQRAVSGPILSCKTESGEQLKGADCGKLKGLDALVLSKLHKLAECPDAATARGRMTLVMHLDFTHGWLSADLGHTQTVAAPDALLACARADLAGASLATVSHDDARYSVVYSVVFESADGAAEAPRRGRGTRVPSRPTQRKGRPRWSGRWRSCATSRRRARCWRGSSAELPCASAP